MKEYQDWKIVGVDVFPQGFAAVASRIKDFKGERGVIREKTA